MSLDILSKPELDSRSEVIHYPVEREAAALPPPAAMQAPAGLVERQMVVPAERRRISLEIVAGLLRGFDVMAALAGSLAAYALATPDLPMAPGYYVLVTLLGSLVLANLLHLCGAYRKDQLPELGRSLSRVLLAWSITGLLVSAVLAVSAGSLMANKTWLVLWLLFGAAPVLLARGALAVCIDSWRQNQVVQQRVAIVGSGPLGLRLLRRMNAANDPDVIVTGVYDDRLSRLPESCMGHKICGSVDDLVADIRRHGIDTVIVALPLSAERRISEVMNRLREVAVDVHLCPDQYGFNLARAEVERIGGVTLLNAEQRPLRAWRGVLKEIEDRVFAGLIVLLISPLLAAIALAIKLDSPGPVFFRQKRYGLNNQLIEVWKFRTMYQHATDHNAEQLTRRNDPRVTRLGAFLRRTSLDELPQFFNVLTGDMSVVGPRPHATAAKAGGLLYQDAVSNYFWRHRMKPGITGWAQVNGWRGETETVEQIEKRVEHDLHYVENWSLGLDVMIILRTVFGGFTGRQAY
jgi:Undecaprenyl-phosphate glucose phosphotransferase